MVKVASDADRETRPRHRPRRRLPGGRRVPRGAQGRLPRRDPRGSGPLVRAGRREPVPHGDPELDVAGPGPQRGPRHRPGPARRDRAERREIARAAGFGDDTAAYREALGADPANVPTTKDELVARANEDIERAMAIAPQYFGVLPKARCEVRAVEEYKEKDAPFAYYYPPKPDGTRDGIYYANGYDLPSRKYTQARLDDVPRGGPRPPLPDHARDGEPAPEHVPAPGLADRRRGLCRGLGPVQRAAGRRDGPLPQRGRALRDARRPGVARRPARRRYRDARAPLAAPALDRLPPDGRPVRDGRRHRDRPLHLLAGPGPHLHDRPARDPAAAGRAGGP